MASISDVSSYYALTYTTLDGATSIASFAWGSNSLNMYREATVPDPGAVGRFAVNAFTRSSAEAGNTASAIANTGAVIVARAPRASAAARIGIIPRGTNAITQLQTLSADPTARVWAMPGDELYFIDSNDPALGSRRLDFYVRPINFRELDAMLQLPAIATTAASTPPVFPVGATTDPLPYSTAPRVVYLITPPSASYLYQMPAPGAVPVGYELVFINTNNLSFQLEATAINGGTDIESRYYVPGRGVVSMISGGGVFAPIGASSTQSRAILTGDPIQLWRGLLRLRFTVVAPEAFLLPDPTVLPNDAVLFATNSNTGTVTLTGSINGGANITLAQGEGIVLVPTGPFWIAVRA